MIFILIYRQNQLINEKHYCNINHVVVNNKNNIRNVHSVQIYNQKLGNNIILLIISHFIIKICNG